jgi:GTP-binding protein
MFVDRAELNVVAGDGGNGIVAWRKEKYIPKGGPAGGDGGQGGSVYVLVDPNAHGLEWFRHTRIIKAASGNRGGSACCKGKDGDDIILSIPPGTLVRDAVTKEIIFDGVTYHERFLLCKGGKGGKGNTAFKSPTNRAPNIATPGEPGEEKHIELELKLIADIGLVGFPNAGKSTLLSQLTDTRPEIAAYPFTTLTPNLGQIRYPDGSSILLTDIPGIIEGAHYNKGLGFEFLRHIERTRALIFVLDAAGIDGRDPLSDYRTLQAELRAYDPDLLNRPSCLVLNKCDEESSTSYVEQFRAAVRHPFIIEISAMNAIGLPSLKECAVELLAASRKKELV